MKEGAWIVEGFKEYLKRRKKSASREELYRFVRRKFRDRKVNIDLASSMLHIRKELFWQAYVTHLALQALSNIASVHHAYIAIADGKINKLKHNLKDALK